MDDCSLEGLKKRKRKEKEKEKAPERNASDLDRSGSSVKEASMDWWDEFCKRIRGCDSQSKAPDDYFEIFFRMSRTTFDYICSFMKTNQTGKLKNLTFKNGTPLSIQDQVAVALTRLSSGKSLGSVGDTIGLSRTNVAQATLRFINAIEEQALHHLQWPASKTERRKIKRSFLKLSGLPNCCGAVDMTHILMKLSVSDPINKYCLDVQKNHSLVLQCIVDHKMRFLDIVTGWPGQMTESSVFQSCNFSKLCNQGRRLNGKWLKLDGSKLKIREYIVGDCGYPLLPYLITPSNEGSKLEFNKAHGKAVMVAKKALARLKERWKIIEGVMWMPDRHKLASIILVCCVLHNIVIDMEDDVMEKKMNMEVCCAEHDFGYQKQVSEISGDVKGAELRDRLCAFLSTNCQT